MMSACEATQLGVATVKHRVEENEKRVLDLKGTIEGLRQNDLSKDSRLKSLESHAEALKLKTASKIFLMTMKASVDKCFRAWEIYHQSCAVVRSIVFRRLVFGKVAVAWKTWKGSNRRGTTSSGANGQTCSICQ